MKYLSFILLLFTSVLLSCEKVVDFQAQSFDPKVVVYGPVVADSPVAIYLGRTRTNYGWSENFAVNDSLESAIVSLQTEGNTSALRLQDSINYRLFNMLTGVPAGLFETNNDAIVDRYFTQSETISPGSWVSFDAEIGAAGARHTFYVPQRAQLRGIGSPTFSDTTYTRSFSYFDRGGEVVQNDEITQWNYNVPVDYQVELEADVEYSVILSYATWQYRWLRNSSTNGFEAFDSTFIVNNQVYRGTGEGLSNLPLVFASQTIPESSDFGFGFYSASGIIDPRSIPKGDTVEVSCLITVVSAYKQREVRQFYGDIFGQNFTSADPFLGSSLDPFTEPSITTSQLEEGLGVMTGYTISKPETVTVKVWRPENMLD